MMGVLRPLGIKPEELSAEGAIGDLCCSPFDSEGRGKDNWRFFLAAGHYDPKRRGVDFYRKMVEDGKSVIVMVGAYKVPAIVAALKGKLFNVLVTDEASAREIIATK